MSRAVDGPDTISKQENPSLHPGWQSQREAKSGICSQLRTHFWTKISQKWGLSVVLITGLALLSRDSGRHTCSASDLPTITARPGHAFSITRLVTHVCHLSDPSCPPHNPGIRLDGHVPLPVTIWSINKSDLSLEYCLPGPTSYLSLLSILSKPTLISGLLTHFHT